MDASQLATRLYNKKVMDIMTRAFLLHHRLGDMGSRPNRKSRGLEQVYIDMASFDMGPFVRSGLFPRAMLTFFRIVQGIRTARKANKKQYRRVRKQPSRLATADFWEEVRDKARALGIGLTGFAPLDENLVFTRDHAGKVKNLYDNAIVLGMEMDYDAISEAPEPAAGLEAMRIYAELGIATNRLAGFVRSKGFGAIACHPLGGPALYPAMAEKAGMGQMGKLGLLVTKPFGPRLRLSMISTNASPLPLARDVDFGVMEFCEKCGQCIRKCPARAIRKQPVPNSFGTRAWVDHDKCFTRFYPHDGCSVCIKVCPFHKKGWAHVMRARAR